MPRLLVEAIEHLHGEVVEELGGHVAIRNAARPPPLQQHHDAGGPTRGALQEEPREVARPLAAIHQLLALLRGEPQVIPVDRDQVTVGAEAREDRRRGAAAGEHDPRPGAQIGKPREQQVEHRRVGRQLVAVVEDERPRRAQPLGEHGEEPTRERIDSEGVLGCERRQRRPPAAAVGGLAEVLEERRRVGVAAIELAPAGPASAADDPASHERALARSRRAADPAHRGCDVDALEQPLATHCPPGGRRADLGRGGIARRHSYNSSQTTDLRQARMSRRQARRAAELPATARCPAPSRPSCSTPSRNTPTFSATLRIEAIPAPLQRDGAWPAPPAALRRVCASQQDPRRGRSAGCDPQARRRCRPSRRREGWGLGRARAEGAPAAVNC